MNKTKVKYSWKQFNKDVSGLTDFLILEKNRGKIKNIYGIPRGGLVLAVVLSHRLEIPLILRKDRISKHTLVVDDISDSGETLKALKKSVKFAYSATLFLDLDSKFIPTSWINTKKSKDWIVFPWETNKSTE